MYIYLNAATVILGSRRGTGDIGERKTKTENGNTINNHISYHILTNITSAGMKVAMEDTVPSAIPAVPAFIIISILILVVTVQFLYSNKVVPPEPKVVNERVKKSEAKVVDNVCCGEIEQLAEFKDGKVVMCRCWRSEKFPYCDGTHNKHNKETGDNVGPLIIKK